MIGEGVGTIGTIVSGAGEGEAVGMEGGADVGKLQAKIARESKRKNCRQRL